MRGTITSVILASLLAVSFQSIAQERASESESELKREIVIKKRYLHFPVGNDEDRNKVKLIANGKVEHYFDIDIAENEGEIRYWASVDVAGLKGKTVTLTTDASQEKGNALDAVEQGRLARKQANLYNEELRPQFHFSPKQGWTNDPNGLVYYDGEYHLFFQHNPFGTNWGNMTWGHAVSRDLIHWRELGDAIHPDELGTIFSGSAVVDHTNTSGLQDGKVPPMLAFYTSAGGKSYIEETPFTQSMAYSTDRGRTWTKYASNPVIGHIEGGNRDPKVFWHEATGRWVMTLYLSKASFVLMGSENLKDWQKLSELPFPNGHECPELFELAVDGNANNTRWIMWEGGGKHMIGQFDGEQFTPETEVLPSEWGKHCYAGQTWNDVPDGRRLFIGWMKAKNNYPDMPFNQQMTFPRVLSLRTTPQGPRLFSHPAKEIEKLHGKEHDLSPLLLKPGNNPLSAINGDLFDIDARLELSDAAVVTLNIRGTPIVYDNATRELSCLGKSVKIESTGDVLEFRVLVDRTSIEIFANDGCYAMSFCFNPEEKSKLALTVENGDASFSKLKITKLRSIWNTSVTAKARRYKRP